MPALTRQVPDGAIAPGFNDEVSTAIAAKRLVIHDAAAGQDGVAVATTTSAPFVGVTMAAIAAGTRGDVQVRGEAILTAGSGGVTIGAKVTGAAAGKGIITTTNNHHVAGEALTAAAEDEEFIIRLTPGAQHGA